MKKFISAILSIAMVLSCVSISVQAEETETVTVTSSKYAIDTASKKISGVAPLTKVGAFESTFSGATVNVVNVDGSSMDDNAYATENVFVNNFSNTKFCFMLLDFSIRYGIINV